jgi:chromosome segregation ATPase
LSTIAADSPLKQAGFGGGGGVVGEGSGSQGGRAGGEEDSDAERQLREMREYLRTLKHKKELAEFRLKDAEDELAREKLRAEHERRELGDVRARLEVEEKRNAAAIGSQQQFDKLQGQVRSLSVFQESNAHLRAEFEEARKRLDQKEREFKEVEAQVLPLRQALSQAKTRQEASDLDMKQLKEELERWKKRATELGNKGAVTVELAEYNKVRASVDAVKAELSEALKSKEQVLKEAEKLRAELKDASNNAAALGKQLEEAKAAAAASAPAETAARVLTEKEIKETETYKAFVEKARNSNEAMIKRLKKKDEELQKLKDDNTSKETEIAALKESAGGAGGGEQEAQSTKAELDLCEASKAALQDELEKLKAEVDKLNEKLSEAMQAKELADQTATDARVKVEKLEAQLKAETQGRQEDAKKSTTKINTLLVQLSEERSKVQQAQQSRAAARAALSSSAAAAATSASTTASRSAQLAVPVAVGAMAGNKRALTEKPEAEAAKVPAAVAATASQDRRSATVAPQKRVRVGGHGTAQKGGQTGVAKYILNIYIQHLRRQGAYVYMFIYSTCGDRGLCIHTCMSIHQAIIAAGAV